MRNALIVVCLIGILISCNQKKRKSVKSLPQMIFKVNDSLLGMKYYDTANGFSINVPKTFEKFELSDNQKEELKKLNIKSVYQGHSPKNGSIFIITDLTTLSAALFSDYTQKLELLIKATTSTHSIDSFYSNNIFIKQYLVKSDSTVQLKVIITNKLKGHYQADFYIPLSVYNKQSNIIESVLGSIN